MTLDSTRMCGMNFHYFRHTLERYLEDMLRLDIPFVELWGAVPHFNVFAADAGEARRVKRLVAERDLTLVCFTPEQCIYPINIASPDNDLRERSVAYFTKALDLSVEMGAPKMMLTPGFGYADQSADDAWNRSADSISKIAARAEALGVTIVLEHLNRFESNLLNTAAEVQRMRDTVNSSAVKIIMDTCQLAVAGESVPDFTRRFGSDLAHVHFCDGTPDGHIAWGTGSLPMEEYLRDLDSAGYAGVLSFEFINAHYWLDPFTPLKNSVERVRSALARMKEAPASTLAR